MMFGFEDLMIEKERKMIGGRKLVEDKRKM